MLSWLFSDPLPVGADAPEFSVLDDAGRGVTLSALRGRYVVVRDHVEELIRVLRDHRHDAKHFYAVRKTDPSTLSSVERAARTIGQSV